jgi:tetraacyldisaccharide 4'-kinase
MISAAYAAVARGRRNYYARRPHLRRALARPVISIGNIAVGGRAKTPLAALVAAKLRRMGERPAILSRGYARRDAPDGVVVVRDPLGLRADLDRAGDEPLMMARALDGVAVLASPNRYLAGRLAELHFGCTVHVLDDGFQHFALHRDADLVVVSNEDLSDPRTLPSGWLREPLDAAAAADAFVALDAVESSRLDALAQGRPVWRARRAHGPATLAEAIGAPPDRTAGSVVALAGIANPRRFFTDLRSAGWTLARELAYRDHHRYSRDDVHAIFRAARETGAQAVVTTEKDLVRLLPFRPFPMAVAAIPLVLELDASDAFDAWLEAAVKGARR